MTEVDTSTEAVDTLARQFNHTSPTRKCLMALAAERDALKAESDRLRESLEVIGNCTMSLSAEADAENRRHAQMILARGDA